MTTNLNPANSQSQRKTAYPTHLTPAQRMALVLRVRPSSGAGYSDVAGNDKTRRISKAAI
jgi:hypothetical protein